MKFFKSFFFLSLITFALSSCQNKEEVEITPDVQEFIIDATPTTNTIELSWSNVDRVSVYLVNAGQTTEDKSLSNTIQNPNTDEVTYTLIGLIPNTEYEISIEGLTQEVNGDLIAKSRTIKVTTENVITTTPDPETTPIFEITGL